MLKFLFHSKNKKASYSNENNFSEEEAMFVTKRMSQNIGPKSSLVEYAALKRGLEVTRLTNRNILIDSKYAFLQMNGNLSSRVGKSISDNKEISRDILKDNKLSVVESEIFTDQEYDSALIYAEKIGYPVVVKPSNLARGKGITTNIKNETQFKKAWNLGLQAYRKSKKLKKLIVERHFEGFDYRFFVVGDKVISATYRKRANVIGDGRSNILELIKYKNLKRKSNPYLGNYLIPEEISNLDVIRKRSLQLSYIPKKNEEVTLRSQSNLSAGGDSIDMTNDVHPKFNEIAVNAIKSIPGILYGGVDIITPDITVKPTPDNHIIGEVEFSPAPLAHFPFIGDRRDMAGAILDYYLRTRID